jgi:hypothetical protein
MLTNTNNSIVNNLVALADLAGNEIIYKADFEALTKTLKRQYEGNEEQVRSLVLKELRDEDNRDLNGIYYALPMYPHQIGSLRKAYNQDVLHAGIMISDDLKATLVSFMETWSEYKALVEKCKPKIVKTRKPSTSERTTPERSLENTGTCPVCGQNCKLTDNGRVVRHGYHVRYGSYHGQCLGTGRDPIEVSANGLIAYWAHLSEACEMAQQSIKDWTNEVHDVARVKGASYDKGTPQYDLLKNQMISKLEADVRMLRRMIQQTQERIDSWTPQTLPGIAAGFAR